MNKKIIWLSVLSSISCLGGAALAATKDVQFATMQGRCERLVVGGKDFTQHCSKNIAQSIHGDGRTGFYLSIGEKAVVTFSGMSGHKPDENKQLQSVDMIIFNLGIEGVEPSVTAASGSCIYGNPYLGQTRIECSALDASGEQSAVAFVTDGSPPILSETQATPEVNRGDSETQHGTANFSLGRWVGWPLDGDEDKGCVMRTLIAEDIGLYVYANSNEAFLISIINGNWNFRNDQRVKAELLFDGVRFPLTEVVVVNPQLLELQSFAEEDGYQALFEKSRRLVIRVNGVEYSFPLTGSEKAAKMLWKCVEKLQ